jgi:heme-degrading monooxygenase HmoA
MKWSEFIKVQVAGGQGQTAIPALVELTAELKQSSGLVEANVYDRAEDYGDVAILLLWDTDQPQQDGSMEGLQLKQVLKTFGLVNHSVWIIH